MKFFLSFLFVLLLYSIALSSEKKGIFTTKQFEIEGVTIGQIYDFKNIYGSYYVIENYFQEDLIIIVEPVIPLESQLVSKKYEPFPDISLIKLVKKEYLVKYGSKAQINFSFEIPDNPEYMDRKFQFNMKILLQSKPKPIIAFTKFLISVSQSRVNVNYLIKQMKLSEPSFDLIPRKCVIDNFPLGKKINLNKFIGEPFELLNNSKQKYAFCITASSFTINLKEGLLNKGTADNNFLSFDFDRVILKPKESATLVSYLLIPDEKIYRGKEFEFFIKAQIDGQVPEKNITSVIIVKTEGD
ncbi:MAG: hypothetical protein ABIJ15_00210 [bacterium]